MIVLLLIVFLIALLAVILKTMPVETASLRPHPNPSKSYEESMRRIEDKIRTEIPPIADYGHTIILTHGHKTKLVAVLYHGYTNCPRQHEQLAKAFFDRGYNVYVPRVPYHGINDRLTKEIRRLSIKDLLEVCDSSVDIACGLGEEITILGLSMGGVMAAFNAQFRLKIHAAVILDPSFAWYFLPGSVQATINLIALLPDTFCWWDPRLKDKHPFPYSMYFHFSLRGVGQIMRLGLSVLRTARREKPLAQNILVMTNDGDKAVDLAATKNLINDWKRLGAKVLWVRFPKSLKMDHDIIDPLQPHAKTEIVYNKIFEYLG
ncbi:MAG: alpha/beta fold hydrolase [Candidatus Omnitrophica bacterium]|nr:alpha/beta fold hydrolase [Candidatus Omnitrophota bacterium]